MYIHAYTHARARAKISDKYQSSRHKRDYSLQDLFNACVNLTSWTRERIQFFVISPPRVHAATHIRMYVRVLPSTGCRRNLLNHPNACLTVARDWRSRRLRDRCKEEDVQCVRSAEPRSHKGFVLFSAVMHTRITATT